MVCSKDEFVSSDWRTRDSGHRWGGGRGYSLLSAETLVMSVPFSLLEWTRFTLLSFWL